MRYRTSVDVVDEGHERIDLVAEGSRLKLRVINPNVTRVAPPCVRCSAPSKAPGCDLGGTGPGPILVRAGTILPLGTEAEHTGQEPYGPLEVRITMEDLIGSYPGEPASRMLQPVLVTRRPGD